MQDAAGRMRRFLLHKLRQWGSPALLVIAFGCAGTVPVEQPIRPYPKDGIESRLRQEVTRWHGTPYRWGGTGQNGIDCSAFVMTVYKKVFDVQLPRTAEFQIQAGRPVDRDGLQAGDLVFFAQPKKTLHIGFYLGDDQFAHASDSKGVTISWITDPYWQQCFFKARRVLYMRL